MDIEFILYFKTERLIESEINSKLILEIQTKNRKK